MPDIPIPPAPRAFARRPGILDLAPLRLLIGGILVLALSLMLTVGNLVFGMRPIDDLLLDTMGRSTTATIVDRQPSEFGANAGGMLPEVTYRYTVDGQTVTGRNVLQGRMADPALAVGEQATIQYWPNVPALSRVEGETVSVPPLALLYIGVGFGALGLFLLFGIPFRLRRARAVLRDGVPVAGEVTALRDKGQTLVVEYRYEPKRGGEECRMAEQILRRYDADELSIGDRLLVIYDEKDPAYCIAPRLRGAVFAMEPTDGDDDASA